MKLSQTPYAKKMRALRRNETAKERETRLSKRREAMRRWRLFQRRITKLENQK